MIGRYGLWSFCRRSWLAASHPPLFLLQSSPGSIPKLIDAGSSYHHVVRFSYICALVLPNIPAFRPQCEQHLLVVGVDLP